MSFSIIEGDVTLRDSSGAEVGISGAPVRVDPTGTTTQPVSVASLPLPSGAATEATLAAVSTATGTQADADTANTVIGRLKQLVTRLAGGLPSALVAGRLDANIGAWLGSTDPSVGQKSMALSIPVTIASDQSPLSFGAQSDIEQGRVFSVAEDVNMATAGLDNPLLLLRNPTGSGKTVYILSASAGCTVTNTPVVFRLFSQPTITTNGTSVNVRNRYVGGVGTSVVLATTLPTLSSNGSRQASLSNAQNQNSVLFAEAYNFAIPSGASAVVTGSPSANNRSAALTVVWVEK